MTHASAAATRITATTTMAHSTEGDFRIGQVVSRALLVLARRFTTFFIVTVVAFSPLLLLNKVAAAAETNPVQAFTMLGGGMVLVMVLNMLSSAVILHGAFRDMRDRPVRLVESLRIGLRRFLPLMVLAFLAAVLVVLGLMLLIVPGLILYTMWFVAVAACVVERRGPWASLRRSQKLTRGHRWKIFGLVLMLLLLLGLIGPLLELVLAAAVGSVTLALVGTLVLSAIGSAFSSVVIAVAYYDLRAAKEGVRLEQIAYVFD